MHQQRPRSISTTLLKSFRQGNVTSTSQSPDEPEVGAARGSEHVADLAHPIALCGMSVSVHRRAEYVPGIDFCQDCERSGPSPPCTKLRSRDYPLPGGSADQAVLCGRLEQFGRYVVCQRVLITGVRLVYSCRPSSASK